MKDLTLPTPPVTVRVLDTAIWIESDMFGAWHVVVQHEGMDAFTFATFNYRYGYTDNASTHAAAVQMAIDLGATEPVEERQRGDNFADAILAIRNGEVEYKSWEPVSNHEDGGRAATDKDSLTVAPVALGGEKGEAVAWQWQTEDGQVGFIDPWQKESGWEQANPRAKLIRPLFAAPVGKARMLTDLEITRCWEATFGYLELGIAIQHKFCEKNGIEVLS